METKTWFSRRYSFNIIPNHIEVGGSIPVSSRKNSLFDAHILFRVIILYLSIHRKGFALSFQTDGKQGGMFHFV